MYDFEKVFMDRIEAEIRCRIKGDIYMQFIGADTFRIDIHYKPFNIHYKWITGGVYTKCMSGKTTAQFASEIIKAYKAYIKKTLFYTKL